MYADEPLDDDVTNVLLLLMYTSSSVPLVAATTTLVPISAKVWQPFQRDRYEPVARWCRPDSGRRSLQFQEWAGPSTSH